MFSFFLFCFVLFANLLFSFPRVFMFSRRLAVVDAGNYKGLARDLFPNADRFLSVLGSVASLFNASGRVIGGLSIDR